LIHFYKRNLLDNMEDNINVPVNIRGETQEFQVGREATLLDLKTLIEEEEGFIPSRQTLFCGPVQLTDDLLLLSELLDLTQNHALDVVFPLATGPDVAVDNQTKGEVWVVVGKSRKEFQRIDLKAGDGSTLTLEKGKLGIVTRHALDAEGRYVYTADRYKIQEGPVVLKNENGGTVVFKQGSNNQLELLEKEDTKEFAPANRTGLQNVAAIFGHFLRGAGESLMNHLLDQL
jgi:hypothetical protein